LIPGKKHLGEEGSISSGDEDSANVDCCPNIEAIEIIAQEKSQILTF